MNEETSKSVNRREVLMGAGILAAAGVVHAAGGSAMAAGEHMDHSAHGMSATKNAEQIAASADCYQKGLVCIAHCVDAYNAGDLSLAACTRTVTNMLIYCNAILQAAANGSPQIKDLARACIAACEACEKECRKHEKHHVQCKDCANGCAECIKACKKLLA